MSRTTATLAAPTTPPRRPGGTTPLDRNQLKGALKERLLALNFHAFAQCMAAVVEKLGYTEVTLAGRTDWKGRNRHGGYDLVATVPGLPLATGSAVPRRRAIVQLKQYADERPVYQRALDELRGTCLRVGASEALLVTTGSFAASVLLNRGTSVEPLIAPVRLLDGDTLLDQMVLHRMGLWEKASAEQGLEVDTSFFENLDRDYPGNGRGDCATAGEPRFLVTVEVEPLSPGRRRSLS